MRLIDADKLYLWTALRPYCSSDVCCEVTDIINNAPTINPYEWISVEDRLPEKPMHCLVFTENKDIDVSYYNEGFYTKYITNWMPLPTPPTEKEN